MLIWGHKRVQTSCTVTLSQGDYFASKQNRLCYPLLAVKGENMKKFLSVLCAFVLLLGAGATLSACGKGEKDNTIKFDSGDYACIVQQDTLKTNSNLTDNEKKLYFLKNDIADEETGLQVYVNKFLDNLCITLNKDSITIASYIILDDMFTKTSVTIKAYTFKNDTLTFEDLDGNNYTIKKNDEGILTCLLQSYYDFSETFEENNKLVFSVAINFEKLTDTSTKQLPTEESIYADKVVSAKYKLNSITGLEDYYDSFQKSMEETDLSITKEQFTKLVNDLCDAKIIIFEDNTMYYSVNFDFQKLMFTLIPEMETFAQIAGYVNISTEIGYICTINTLEENKYSASRSGTVMNEYTFDENGNLMVTANLPNSKNLVTYIYTKINEVTE